MNRLRFAQRCLVLLLRIRKTAEQLDADLSISLFCGLGGATTFFIWYVIWFKSVMDNGVSNFPWAYAPNIK